MQLRSIELHDCARVTPEGSGASLIDRYNYGSIKLSAYVSERRGTTFVELIYRLGECDFVAYL